MLMLICEFKTYTAKKLWFTSLYTETKTDSEKCHACVKSKIQNDMSCCLEQ